MAAPQGPRRGGPGVTVDRADVHRNLHDGYLATISNLMQENAELLAAVNTLGAHNQELQTQVSGLLAGAGVVTLPPPPAAAPPDGV